MHILITGSAGFIGFHLTKLLLAQNHTVVGIDSINNYYSTKLKLDRLFLLNQHENFEFFTINICNKEELDELFRIQHFDMVINLAAQAGVRYSIEKPYKYLDSNLIGFVNILEACRNYKVDRLVFASSSSVYGNSSDVPFNVSQMTDQPESLYAATKKANELMAYSYSRIYGIKSIGLRFFTVYGPWGRPDMAYFSFANRIMKGETIQVYNHGNMERDFTGSFSCINRSLTILLQVFHSLLNVLIGYRLRIKFITLEITGRCGYSILYRLWKPIWVRRLRRRCFPCSREMCCRLMLIFPIHSAILIISLIPILIRDWSLSSDGLSPIIPTMPIVKFILPS